MTLRACSTMRSDEPVAKGLPESVPCDGRGGVGVGSGLSARMGLPTLRWPALPPDVAEEHPMAVTEPDAIGMVNPEGAELVKDPFTTYSRIREQARLVRAGMPGVEPFWIVTRYEDVKAVMNDPRFVVNTANVPGMEDTPNRMDQIQIANGISPEYVEYSRANLTSVDGDDHLRLRKLVSQAFTARRINELRPRVEEITAELLDRLPAVAQDGV